MSIETNLNQSPYFDDFDEDKNFHIRLDISSLVSEKIKINNSDNMIAKGIFKIECYPGDKPEKIVSELIKKNIDD